MITIGKFKVICQNVTYVECALHYYVVLKINDIKDKNYENC
jgi:hypothetical protein